MPFRVVYNNIGLDVDIAIRCHGEYSYKIINPMLFYTNVCGNVEGLYLRETIDSQLKTELLTALQPAFAKISDMGIRYISLPAHTMEIGNALNEVLSAEWRDLRGIEIVVFGVSSVNASEEDEKMIEEIQRNAAFRNLTMAAAHMVGAQAQAMQDVAKNENAKVRRRAALAIGNSTNKTLDGAVDAVISLMDDSDNEVRKVAYQYSGMLENDRVVEPIVKLLKNEADSELHGSGIEGLVSLWYDYPQHKNTSEAAYRATMDYLRNEPRNDKVPYWTAIGSFASKNEKNYDAWREKATYFNPDEIMQVMTNIVKIQILINLRVRIRQERLRPLLERAV